MNNLLHSPRDLEAGDVPAYYPVQLNRVSQANDMNVTDQSPLVNNSVGQSYNGRVYTRLDSSSSQDSTDVDYFPTYKKVVLCYSIAALITSIVLWVQCTAFAPQGCTREYHISASVLFSTSILGICGAFCC